MLRFVQKVNLLCLKSQGFIACLFTEEFTFFNDIFGLAKYYWTYFSKKNPIFTDEMPGGEDGKGSFLSGSLIFNQFI
ncbi:hypothetical protein SAMN04489864_104249 [Pedobacter insulae]|uniref:Uncharacterized protein n=1 Tax=Pedobacter insulae TaxID=414048 RepID=A0A1I2WRX9_9SPHI|nr:hypothetical protein SAMN04489864_104249 [Pedobacter insulae]